MYKQIKRQAKWMGDDADVVSRKRQKSDQNSDDGVESDYSDLQVELHDLLEKKTGQKLTLEQTDNLIEALCSTDKESDTVSSDQEDKDDDSVVELEKEVADSLQEHGVDELLSLKTNEEYFCDLCPHLSLRSPQDVVDHVKSKGHQQRLKRVLHPPNPSASPEKAEKKNAEKKGKKKMNPRKKKQKKAKKSKPQAKSK